MPDPTLRGLLRTTLRPVIAKLDQRWGRVPDPVMAALHRLERRADALEAAATRLSEGASSHQEEVAAVAPLLLDAVATQHSAMRAAGRRDQQMWAAIERDEHRLADLERRLEVVRQEVLFEFRYGRVDGGGRSEMAVEPKVLDEAKVDSMRGALRLNVGSGSLGVDGYVNVDARAIDGVDVVADVGSLPFDDGSVEEVRSSHVLEHFPEQELRRRVLPHWVAKLRPGGMVRAVVPDATSMIEAWSKGTLAFDVLREVTFGGQEYEGDFHFTMFSVESLTALLQGAGLAGVEVISTGRPNGMCLEMELVARKPDGWLGATQA